MNKRTKLKLANHSAVIRISTWRIQLLNNNQIPAVLTNRYRLLLS